VRILVLVKRVPATGGRIVLTADGQDIDTRHLGFTISPHEECGVEEAVRIVERDGGSTTVLTLGPPEAAEQLRDAVALGIEEPVLLETDGSDWDPIATSVALVDAIGTLEREGGPFDLILAGNESADAGGFQVAIRVAVALDRPFITGVKALEFSDGRAIARREAAGGRDVFEAPLPAIVTVREGINLPRYPSVPGRLRAKRKEVRTIPVTPGQGGPTKLGLRLPVEEGAHVEVLGSGPDAAPRVVEVLQRIGVVAR
jgi:electron transfer flavoprotein beta subunit